MSARDPALDALDDETVRAMLAMRAIVDEQAEDEGLWFDSQTASEVYLQRALRRLHAAVEEVVGD
jgi:hypothetical protein